MGKNKSVAIKDKTDLKRIQSYLKQTNYPAFILFQIGIMTGYRGGDLVKLTVADLRKAIEEKKFYILEEKSNKYRSSYIGENLIRVLKDFIREKEDIEFVYPSRNGKGKYKDHIKRETLGKIYKKAFKELNIKVDAAGTHTPRKTFGYMQYHINNRDIVFVQELFNHSTCNITRRYIGIDEEEKAAAADEIDKYI